MARHRLRIAAGAVSESMSVLRCHPLGAPPPECPLALAFETHDVRHTSTYAVRHCGCYGTIYHDIEALSPPRVLAELGRVPSARFKPI